MATESGVSLTIESKEPTYIFENGQYHFYLMNDYLFSTDEVGLFFDKQSGTLLKHGVPTIVNKRHAESVKAYEVVGQHDIIANLVCISGKFDVEELNKCTQITGYISKFYSKLLAQNPT